MIYTKTIKVFALLIPCEA